MIRMARWGKLNPVSWMLPVVGLGVLVGACGFQVTSPQTGDYKLADLSPTRLPYPHGSLVIAGTTMPVDVLREEKPGEVVFLLRSKHGAVLEHEAYRFDDEMFSLWRASGALYDPVIPLLRQPVAIGERWNWSGKMIDAIDGHPTELPSGHRPATATVETVREPLNVRGGPLDSVRVNVVLSMDSGSAQRAERRLTFWFVPGQGMIKREFAYSSTRQPSGEDEP